jgi:hypothetical protein
MTNLAINANGLVGFSSGAAAFGSGYYGNYGTEHIPLTNIPCATIAAFWDDLYMWPEMGSTVSFAVIGADGGRTGVVEFAHMGFHGYYGTNDFVSFQVQFSELETNAVRVVFSEANGQGCGAAATLGALSTGECGVEYSFDDDGSVFPGLAIEYHVGIGTSPAKTDTDDDGLGDAEELALGTNPHDSDTDRDGLLDKWEIEHPPFSPLDATDGAADADGDRLSNAYEVMQLGSDWQDPDTDDDGLTDGEECGYACASPIPQESFDMTGATDILCQYDDIDQGRLSISLPFPIRLPDADVCSNLVVLINGELALATDAEAWMALFPCEERPVIVRAFSDDLLAYTNELGSALSVAAFGTNGVRRFVVEYR